MQFRLLVRVRPSTHYISGTKAALAFETEVEGVEQRIHQKLRGIFRDGDQRGSKRAVQHCGIFPLPASITHAYLGTRFKTEKQIDGPVFASACIHS